VAIVGFGRRVEVYSSKQKPKLLTVYCDDFRWGWGWEGGPGDVWRWGFSALMPRSHRTLPLPPAHSRRARARSFVVKGGEDVRIDERLQQLMRLMGGLVGRDPDCVARGLAGGGSPGGGGGSPGALVTYDVVPMSPRLGVMEFVQVGLGPGGSREGLHRLPLPAACQLGCPWQGAGQPAE
jgi:DNA-dependent protein kinase catalytic subunit